jgi:hypothetical protein
MEYRNSPVVPLALMFWRATMAGAAIAEPAAIASAATVAMLFIVLFE